MRLNNVDAGIDLPLLVSQLAQVVMGMPAVADEVAARAATRLP